MNEVRHYRIMGMLWLILASLGDADDWLGLVASGMALAMAFGYLVASSWVSWQISKEGRDG